MSTAKPGGLVQRRSVLPDWLVGGAGLAGYSDDDGTDGTGLPVRFVRLLFCDAAGLRRCRVVPIRTLERVMRQGLGMTRACMGMNVWGDTFPADCGLDATGEVRLVPDAQARSACPWHPSHDIALVDMHETPGQPWECCPRSALRRVLDAAQQAHGLTFLAGHELEFYLLRPGIVDEISGGLPEPIDQSLYSQSGAFDAVSSLMDDLCNSLDSLSIPVEQLHAESGPGQFELALAPDAGVAAADAALLAREAIAAISHRHGLVCSLLPKPFPSAGGSGAHMHLSMRAGDGGNLFADLAGGLAGEGSLAESFVAGLLEHLAALLVFTAPSPLSYARLQPGTWAGAFRAWGINNREAPLRFCPGASSASANVEVKCVDSTCNPHIAMAAIVTAGLQGIERKLRLPPGLEGDPAQAEAAERLPASLWEAIEAFEKDQTFRQAAEAALGPKLLQAFLAVRRLEARTADGMSREKQITTLHARY